MVDGNSSALSIPTTWKASKICIDNLLSRIYCLGLAVMGITWRGLSHGIVVLLFSLSCNWEN